jgi:hypothetical protein
MPHENKGSAFCTYEQGMFPEKLHRSLGDRPFDVFFEQEAVAIHEAGHAVAARLLGIEFESVELKMEPIEGGSKLSGACVAQEDGRRLHLPNDYGTFYRVHGIITLAGPAAERKYRQFQNLPMNKGNGDDHDNFDTCMGKHLEIAAGRRSDAFRRLIWRRAQTMMEVEQVWNAVFDLALHLTGLMEEELGWTDEAPPTTTVSLPWSAVTDAVHRSGLEKVAIEDIFPRMAMTGQS